MPEVLSQSQIDALLNSLSSDEPEEESVSSPEDNVRKYDFYSPKKFTKDRLKLLDGVYENFSRVLSSHLSGVLRVNCNIELDAVEELRYYEFNNGLNENDALAIFYAESEQKINNDDPVILHMSNQILYAILDRLLGGSDSMEQNYTSDNMTGIELVVYENILNHVSPIMGDVWMNYVELAFNFDKIETNPRLMQALALDEIVVVVVFDIVIKEAQGKLTLCLPSSLLESIFKAFELNLVNNKKQNNHEKATEEIMDSIRSSPLDVVAKIGEVSMLLNDLYTMKPGDVINLGKPKDSEVYLYIDDEPWFTGKLGTNKQNMAVKINGLCENIISPKEKK